MFVFNKLHLNIQNVFWSTFSLLLCVSSYLPKAFDTWKPLKIVIRLSVNLLNLLPFSPSFFPHLISFLSSFLLREHTSTLAVKVSALIHLHPTTSKHLHMNIQNLPSLTYNATCLLLSPLCVTKQRKGCEKQTASAGCHFWIENIQTVGNAQHSFFLFKQWSITHQSF